MRNQHLKRDFRRGERVREEGRVRDVRLERALEHRDLRDDVRGLVRAVDRENLLELPVDVDLDFGRHRKRGALVLERPVQVRERQVAGLVRDGSGGVRRRDGRIHDATHAAERSLHEPLRRECEVARPEPKSAIREILRDIGELLFAVPRSDSVKREDVVVVGRDPLIGHPAEETLERIAERDIRALEIEGEVASDLPVDHGPRIRGAGQRVRREAIDGRLERDVRDRELEARGRPRRILKRGLRTDNDGLVKTLSSSHFVLFLNGKELPLASGAEWAPGELRSLAGSCGAGRSFHTRPVRQSRETAERRHRRVVFPCHRNRIPATHRKYRR